MNAYASLRVWVTNGKRVWLYIFTTVYTSRSAAPGPPTVLWLAEDLMGIASSYLQYPGNKQDIVTSLI